ncbi:hypothetical protein ACJMK2_033479 [Sinanodonta woodiana]|uniref:Fringe-like glycosyltransferase domain-containing protein n=1 Tax=Sinanodonta woodiana TaxID=1069815 RepID=A0ABD3WPV0_SINWO
MRLSLRPAAKLTALAALVFILNVFIWSNYLKHDFNDESTFVGTNQHGRQQQPVAQNVNLSEDEVTPLYKYKRSAKSFKGTVDTIKNEGENLQKVLKVAQLQPTQLDDIYISVKTTKNFHQSRLRLIIDTWVTLAREQTYFFTDADDLEIQKLLPSGHLINTNCSSDHSRKALCCKMASEYDCYMASNKRWFCHVDDDTYVNVPQLVALLQKYNHSEDWYLGKPSLRHPLEIIDRNNPVQKLAFWFATGGAGICISKALALKMLPYTGGGKLMTVGEKIRLPDDCTVGYIINYILRKDLTVINEFRSHLEALWQIRVPEIKNQITFSYAKYGEKNNILRLEGFDENKDPTRFWSIHCHLFPYTKQCANMPR